MNVDDFLKHLDKSLFLTKGCKSIMSGGSDSSITMSIGGAETDDNQDANPDTTQDNNNIEGFAKADDTAKKQINESAEREASGKQDAKDKIMTAEDRAEEDLIKQGDMGASDKQDSKNKIISAEDSAASGLNQGAEGEASGKQDAKDAMKSAEDNAEAGLKQEADNEVSGKQDSKDGLNIAEEQAEKNLKQEAEGEVSDIKKGVENINNVEVSSQNKLEKEAAIEVSKLPEIKKTLPDIAKETEKGVVEGDTPGVEEEQVESVVKVSGSILYRPVLSNIDVDKLIKSAPTPKVSSDKTLVFEKATIEKPLSEGEVYSINGEPIRKYVLSGGANDNSSNNKKYHILGIDNIDSFNEYLKNPETYKDRIYEIRDTKIDDEISGIFDIKFTETSLFYFGDKVINGMVKEGIDESLKIYPGDYIICYNTDNRSYIINDFLKDELPSNNMINGIKIYRFSDVDKQSPVKVMEKIEYINKTVIPCLKTTHFVSKGDIVYECEINIHTHSIDRLNGLYHLSCKSEKEQDIPVLLTEAVNKINTNIDGIKNPVSIDNIYTISNKLKITPDTIFTIYEKVGSKWNEINSDKKKADFNKWQTIVKPISGGGGWFKAVTGGAPEKPLDPSNYMVLIGAKGAYNKEKCPFIIPIDKVKNIGDMLRHELIYGKMGDKSDDILLYGHIDYYKRVSKLTIFAPLKYIDDKYISYNVNSKIENITLTPLKCKQSASESDSDCGLDEVAVTKSDSLKYYGYDSSNKDNGIVIYGDNIYTTALANIQLKYLSIEESAVRELEKITEELYEKEEIIKQKDAEIKLKCENNKIDGKTDVDNKSDGKTDESNGNESARIAELENQIKDLERECGQHYERINKTSRSGIGKPMVKNDKSILELFYNEPGKMKKLRNLVYSLIQITKLFAPYSRVIYDEDLDCEGEDIFEKYMSGVNIDNNLASYTKGSVFRWGLIQSLYKPKTANTTGMAIMGTSRWDNGKLQCFGFNEEQVGKTNNGDPIYSIEILKRSGETSIGSIEHIIDAARLNLAGNYNPNEGIRVQSGGRGQSKSTYDFGPGAVGNSGGIIKWSNEAYYTEYRQAHVLKLLRQKLIEIFLVLSLMLALKVEDYAGMIGNYPDYGYDGSGQASAKGDKPYDALKGFFPENKTTTTYYRILENFIDEDQPEPTGNYGSSKASNTFTRKNKGGDRLHFFFKQIRNNKFLKSRDNSKINIIFDLIKVLDDGDQYAKTDDNTLNSEQLVAKTLAKLKINNFTSDISDMLKNTNIYEETGFVRNSRTKSGGVLGKTVKESLEYDFRNFIDTYVNLQYDVKNSLANNREDYFLNNTTNKKEIEAFINELKLIGKTTSSSDLKRLKIKNVVKCNYLPFKGKYERKVMGVSSLQSYLKNNHNIYFRFKQDHGGYMQLDLDDSKQQDDLITAFSLRKNKQYINDDYISIVLREKEERFDFLNRIPKNNDNNRQNSILNYYPLIDRYNPDMPFGNTLLNLRTVGGDQKTPDIKSISVATGIKNHYRKLFSLFTEMIMPERNEFKQMQLFSLEKKENCYDINIFNKYKLLNSTKNKWYFNVEKLSELQVKYPHMSNYQLQTKFQNNKDGHTKIDVIVANRQFDILDRETPLLVVTEVTQMCKPNIISKIKSRKLYKFIRPSSQGGKTSLEQDINVFRGAELGDNELSKLELDQKTLKFELFISDINIKNLLEEIPKEIYDTIFENVDMSKERLVPLKYNIEKEGFYKGDKDRFNINDLSTNNKKDLLVKLLSNSYICFRGKIDGKEIDLCSENEPFKKDTDSVNFRYIVDPQNIIHSQLAYDPYAKNINKVPNLIKLPENQEQDFIDTFKANTNIVESVQVNIDRKKTKIIPECIQDRINSLPIYDTNKLDYNIGGINANKEATIKTNNKPIDKETKIPPGEESNQPIRKEKDNDITPNEKEEGVNIGDKLKKTINPEALGNMVKGISLKGGKQSNTRKKITASKKRSYKRR